MNPGLVYWPHLFTHLMLWVSTFCTSFGMKLYSRLHQL